MTGKDWLIVVIVLALVVGTGVPLLGSYLRSRDFKAQAEGKKPIRSVDEVRGRVDAAQDLGRKQADYESMKTVAEMKSKQNLAGPK